ncbi:hypothetical protein [Streptomyces sp. NPDC048442]|uniref:hypothetical protein n=1 Tax=Streptomyces sp. NPDC048442 TaxID=3154823 RepID=UPI00342435F3
MRRWANGDFWAHDARLSAEAEDEARNAYLVPGWLGPEAGGHLTADVRREYAAEIEALASTGAAERCFQRYRDGRLLLVGAGSALSDLVGGALRTGCRDLLVGHSNPSDAPDAAVLSGLVERSRRDDEQRVRLADDDGALTTTDIVLQASRSVAELIATADRCAEAEVLLGQVLFNEEELWAGPVGPAHRTAAASGWRRLRGNSPAGPQSRQNPHDVPPDLVTHQLLRAWLRCATATGVATTGATTMGVTTASATTTGVATTSGTHGSPYLLRTDLRTRMTSRHPYRPFSAVPGVPAAPAAPAVPATKAVSEAEARSAFLGRLGGAGVDEGALQEGTASVVDPWTGPVRAGEASAVEVGPYSLWEYEMGVADPFAVRPAGTPALIVTGHGRARETAHLAALLAALASYAALVACALAEGAADPWGLDLVTGGLRRVPVRDAHPAPTADAGAPFRPPVGAAAGLTWAHALEAGLAQHCDDLLARRLAEPGTRVPRLVLPIHEAAETAGLTDVLGPLHLLGDPVAHDLSALLGVPACALRSGQNTVLASGVTPAEAVRNAAERALAARRSRAGTVAGVGPQQEEQLSRPAGAGTTPGRARFVEALQASGRTPVAVLLDHDPQVVETLPFVVQVVLIEE